VPEFSLRYEVKYSDIYSVKKLKNSGIKFLKTRKAVLLYK